MAAAGVAEPGGMSYEDAMMQAMDIGSASGGGEQTLSAGTVAGVVNKSLNQVYGACVRGSVGKVKIDIAIAGSGQVMGVSVNAGDAGFQKCVADQVRKIRFPVLPCTAHGGALQLRHMRLVPLALLALWFCLGSARAEEASAQSPEGSYFPDALLDHRAHEEASARKLEHLLGGLSGVQQARVAWSRAHPSLVPLDQPVPPPKVTVLLQTSDGGPRHEELAAVLEDLQSSETPRPTLRLVTTHAAPQGAMASAAQDETNKSPFRTLLALSLAANVLLATVLLLRARARG